MTTFEIIRLSLGNRTCGAAALAWVTIWLVCGGGSTGLAFQWRDGIVGAPTAQNRGLAVLVLAPPGVQTARVTISAFSGFWSSRIVSIGEKAYFEGLPPGNLHIRAEAFGFKVSERTISLGEDVTLELKRSSNAEERFPRIDESVADASLLSIPRKALDEMRRAQRSKGAEDAVKHLLKAVKVHPTFVQAYSDLGAQYLRLGKPAEAERACRKALQIDPEFTRARANLAAILLSEGKSDEAIQEYRHVLELEPRNLQALVGLGRAYVSIEQFVLAVKRFDQAAQIDPASAQAQFGLARSYLKLGMHHEALPSLRRYLELEPESEWAPKIRDMIERIEGSTESERRSSNF